jgi:hypothetical protein
MSYYEQQIQSYHEEAYSRLEDLHEKYTLEIDRLNGQLRRERAYHDITRDNLVEAQTERLQLIELLTNTLNNG